MRPRFFLVALVSLYIIRVGHTIPAADLSVPVPVARLVENVSQYIKTHPQDAEGYYVLARVYSIAFTRGFLQNEPSTVTVIRGGAEEKTEEQIVGKPQRVINATLAGSPNYRGAKGLPNVRGYDYEKPNNPITSEHLFYLRESIRNYTKATALDPKEARNWLGLAWMLEQGIPYASRMGVQWDANSTKRYRATSAQWIDKAEKAYRRTYELEKARITGNNYSSPVIEAGESLLRLKALHRRTLTTQDKAEIKRIRLDIAVIKRRPRVISPVIVPLGQQTSLPSLLSTNKKVTFDLTGDNLGKRWPWVGSGTGILVWDPQRQGKITSGRQLFGSVTWWIFWKNGYQALAALDNNGDGTLTGSELEGIAIWRDANGNGASDAGEVKPLSEWNIVSVATRPTDQVSGMPSNLRGITRTDGTIVPSYDWTPRSLN